MKGLLLFFCISPLLYSCDELDYELPLASISGVAFTESRDTAIYIDTSAVSADLYIMNDECLNTAWTYPEENLP